MEIDFRLKSTKSSTKQSESARYSQSGIYYSLALHHTDMQTDHKPFTKQSVELNVFVIRRGSQSSSEDPAKLQSSNGEKEAGDESYVRRLQEKEGRGEEQTVQAHTVR